MASVEQELRDRIRVMAEQIAAQNEEIDRLRAERELLDSQAVAHEGSMREVMNSVGGMAEARRRVLLRARRAELDSDRLADFINRLADFLQARGYSRMADLLALIAAHTELVDRRTEE